MTKCKYCGFDSEEEFLVAEGAPCGYNGCYTLTCCHEAWKEHCKITHSEYYEKELKK
jgi:hypothetical protein